MNISISCSETVEEAEDKYKGWNNSDNRDPEKPKYEMRDDGLVIHMQRIPKRGHMGNTDKLTIDDVPDHLLSYVDEKQIQEYNENLPDKAEIMAYEYEAFRYKAIKENGVVLNIDMSNDGNEKATDIHVDFSLPKSFFVVEKPYAIDLALKKGPKMPENPIEKAEEMYSRKLSGQIDNPLYDYVSRMGNIMPLMPFSSGVSASLNSSLSNFDKGWSVTAKQHNAHIWKDSLMHTYHWFGGEFCIAPTEAGEFTIGISVICEELGEPMRSEFKVTVIDEGWKY